MCKEANHKLQVQPPKYINHFGFKKKVIGNSKQQTIIGRTDTFITGPIHFLTSNFNHSFCIWFF
jgi:hypothetical protein